MFSISRYLSHSKMEIILHSVFPTAMEILWDLAQGKSGFDSDFCSTTVWYSFIRYLLKQCIPTWKINCSPLMKHYEMAEDILIGWFPLESFIRCLVWVQNSPRLVATRVIDKTVFPYPAYVPCSSRNRWYINTKRLIKK